MPSTIIADASCLILLSRIGRLGLLQGVFGSVVVTPEVAEEFGVPLPDWMTIKSVGNRDYQRVLEVNLDRGEASSIALAIEARDALLIIDDRKGRNHAIRLGLRLTGTIGVILAAKEKGLIPEVASVLKAVCQTDFRISERIILHALERAGEEVSDTFFDAK
jgi:predicted nucleic acid-binding protein